MYFIYFPQHTLRYLYNMEYSYTKPGTKYFLLPENELFITEIDRYLKKISSGGVTADRKFD